MITLLTIVPLIYFIEVISRNPPRSINYVKKKFSRSGPKVLQAPWQNHAFLFSSANSDSGRVPAVSHCKQLTKTFRPFRSQFVWIGILWVPRKFTITSKLWHLVRVYIWPSFVLKMTQRRHPEKKKSTLKLHFRLT